MGAEYGPDTKGAGGVAVRIRAQVKKWAVVAAVVCGTVAAATVSAVAVHDSATIHACVGVHTGDVRIVDGPGDCDTRREVVRTWNEAGPQGPQGEPGRGLVALDELQGLPCNTSHDDLAGTAHLEYDNDGAHGVSITCVPTKKSLTVEAVSVPGYRCDVSDCSVQTPLEGHGSVTVTPPDAIYSTLDGPSSGTHWYSVGTTVTITADPASDSTFLRWEGCRDESTATCTITVAENENARVSALFGHEDADG